MSEKQPQSDPTDFPIAKLEAGNGELQPAAVLSAQDLACWISAKLDTKADKLLVNNAMNGQCPALKELKDGDTFECRIIIGHFTKEVETDQAVKVLRRFVFIGPDGAMLDSSGVAMPRCVAGLRATFGVGPWDDPVVLKIHKVSTGQPEPMVTLSCLGQRSDLAKHQEKPDGKSKRS